MAYETVGQKCKLQFLQPSQTRKSSLFLAVEKVVHIIKERDQKTICNVCKALKIKMYIVRTCIVFKY